MSKDFDNWFKSGRKLNYNGVLGVNNELMIFIKDYMPWLLQEGNIIEIELIVEAYRFLLKEGKISQKRVDLLEKNLIDLKFNSMLVNW